MLNSFFCSFSISIRLGRASNSTGKKGRGHLANENVAQPRSRTVVAHDPDTILVVVGGNKKGKPLDMVPVHVGDEQRKIDRAWSEFLLQRGAECADASARIKHDDLTVCTKLDTCGVSPVTKGVASRHWNRAPHAQNLTRAGIDEALGMN